MSIVVVIPSRGRPERARVAIEALRANALRIGTSVVLAVDRSDPLWNDYRALSFFGAPEVHMVTLEGDETGDLVKATNTVSMRIAKADPECIIGNLGDDHLVRTPGWDRLVIDALASPGIVYGDDLLQGENLPTAPFISAEIVNALGWFALPSCRHLYIDDCWRELGKASGVLRYLPELVIEHIHPGIGKAEWDEGYERANNEETVRHDRDAYLTWKAHWMNADMRAIFTALNVWADKGSKHRERLE